MLESLTARYGGAEHDHEGERKDTLMTLNFAPERL